MRQILNAKLQFKCDKCKTFSFILRRFYFKNITSRASEINVAQILVCPLSTLSSLSILITCPLELHVPIFHEVQLRSIFSIGSDTRQSPFQGPSFNRYRWENRRKLQPSGNPITDPATAINASSVSSQRRRGRRNVRRNSRERRKLQEGLCNFSLLRRERYV